MVNPISYIIKDVRRIPLGVKLVVFVIVLRTIGWGFVDPYYSIFIENFSQNYTVVGLFMAILNMVSLFMLIPLMRLTDRVKDARIMEDGEILYFAAMLLYVFAGMTQNVIFLIIALFVNGIAHPLLIVGAESYIRKHSHGGSARSFGFYTALGHFGWIFGMFMAAFLIPYYTFNTMFLFVLPGILISFFILPKIRERGITSLIRGFKKYFHRTQDFKDILYDLKGIDKKMIFFLILALFDGMIMMFTYVFIPLFALVINLSLSKIALLMAVMYLPFIFSFFFSEVSDRLSKMNVIAVGLFIGAVSFVLLTFIVHQLWVVVLASMTSLSLAIIRPAYNGMITHLSPRRMLGEITGLNNLFVRIGYIIGPIFSGIIADLYSIQVAFFLVAIVAFGLGAITLLLKAHDQLAA
ncbi:MFS transporter [Patescibacteria group bacterium]|nr:MFS transporter [Patescibacteria group bacterium]MBU1683584.1 MFS transporter [Patescibacteria group bacterium]MBU1935531.1 MFS transporter [Patescibacteria group bacterium]